MSAELLNCPFCDGRAQVHERCTDDGKPFYVKCDGCFIEVAYASTWEASIEMWNRRATAAASQAQPAPFSAGYGAVKPDATAAAKATAAAHAAQQGEQARIERMKHDFPHLIEFYGKHALGPMLPPSCLCCGQSTKDRKIGIRHMELPGVVICEPCMQAARSAPRPVLTEEQIAAISRALEALNEAKNDCPSLAEKQREYYESVISGLRALREGGGDGSDT